jgi:AmiR/NasT family two-component response regulator
MERQHVTDDEAFQILVRASQRLNIKLTAVAASLADTRVSKARRRPDRRQGVSAQKE